MFNSELSNFLLFHNAKGSFYDRLESLDVETLAQAIEALKSNSDDIDPERSDLIWVVTQQEVMSPENRRSFLLLTLSSIEDKLTDAIKNTLIKIRSDEPISTDEWWYAYDNCRSNLFSSEKTIVRSVQFEWIIKNFKLCDLHIN